MFLFKLLWLPVTIALTTLTHVFRLGFGLLSFALGHIIVLGIIIGGFYLLTR